MLTSAIDDDIFMTSAGDSPTLLEFFEKPAAQTCLLELVPDESHSMGSKLAGAKRGPH